ncbi:sterol 3-beta-glucosyltransferase UGT80A2-like isoform X6 [Benincasa hispida]|uniref:sterol 3-beta-glucosyltransferase UGT80A2-like isoform X6 n=1 Tax=Benincasa hispida TaxID=102211 RepID=UPI0018FF42F4|nr:sterol 3-beta-glucosyltransferase UGT80A2-like isoform X6 [Benincasa hispida]
MASRRDINGGFGPQYDHQTTPPGVPGRTFSKANSLHVEISSDTLESTSFQHRLQRSKTERLRHETIFTADAAQILDNKIPIDQKFKLLHRVTTVKDDGTVEFEVQGDIESQSINVESEEIFSNVHDEHLDTSDFQYIRPMQIVILIVGTRGDVQPFIPIGKRLQDYGHRVRLATHPNFKEFVLMAGLEFYPLGGDPKQLAACTYLTSFSLMYGLSFDMVRNKGFLPSGPSEILIQRNQMKEIIYSLLPACKDPDMDSGIPFEADAIIANRTAYGQLVNFHIHYPESSNKQGIGKKKLKIRPVTYLSGSQSSESDVPHVYLWSPYLVPKPKGYCFFDLASNFEPPESLVKWLEAGDKPIYIGFGSLPVQEPEKMTQIIIQALETTKQRGIINEGWGGLGKSAEQKDFIYLLDDCPHDWLLPKCKAVVHHGGAGTTAAGLKAACPTTVVPFFGDQPFWGERVHARGVGPPPIPVDEFSLPRLVNAINYMLDPKVKQQAVELGKALENEDGVEGAVRAFFRQLSSRKIEPEPEPQKSSLLFIRRCFGCS